MVANQNLNVLTYEEAYELVGFYVSKFWDKFYTLARDYDQEDVVQEIFAKFVAKGYIAKYNSQVTSKKYFIMNGVRTSMIDMVRKQRQMAYLDQPDQEGLTLGEKLPESNIYGIQPASVEDKVVSGSYVLSLINKLPSTTDSKVPGYSPILGECNMSLRNIAIHLMYGYEPKEIAAMYINPRSNKPVSSGRIHQLIAQIKKILSQYMDEYQVQEAH